MEHYRQCLACHANQDPRASFLARRVEGALGVVERLDVEVGDIGIAVQQLYRDVEARVEATYHIEHQKSAPQLLIEPPPMPADGSYVQPGNAASLEVDPSLAFSSPYSLDFNRAALNERESHQKAAEWSNRRLHDSGFYSVGSSQQVKQTEIPPSTNLSLGNVAPNHNQSTQGSQPKAVNGEQGFEDNISQTPALALPGIGAGFPVSSTPEWLTFYINEEIGFLEEAETSDEGMN